MIERLNAREALARIPGWELVDVEFESLPGGLSNETYRFHYESRDYILRVDGEQAFVLRFDRTQEIRVAGAAYSAGIGPQVFYWDEDDRIMLREYVHGRVWEPSDLKDAGNLEKLAALLRKVHALPRSGIPVNLLDDAQIYLEYLDRRHGPAEFARTCREIIRSVPRSDTVVVCHNDIVASNVIERDGLILIDWEYASDNDPFFDLASIIGYHDFGESQIDVLLSAYTGRADPQDRRWLDEQIRVYDAVQWLWLATRQLIHPGRWQAQRLSELQNRIR